MASRTQASRGTHLTPEHPSHPIRCSPHRRCPASSLPPGTDTAGSPHCPSPPSQSRGAGCDGGSPCRTPHSPAGSVRGVGLFIWALVCSGEEMGLSCPPPPQPLHPHHGDETTSLSLLKEEPSGTPTLGAEIGLWVLRHGESWGFQGTVFGVRWAGQEVGYLCSTGKRQPRLDEWGN